MTDGTPTVLVVDDEEHVAEVYELVLGDDYDVRTALDGTAALEALDESVDVVLLDRRMPGLSGREVLAEIRAREVDVRVAIVTAVDPAFDVVEMSFDGYLTKPVDDEALRAVVEDLLALSTYDDRTRERVAVARKQALLEAEMSERDLAASAEYERLRDRAAELDEEVDELAGAMDEGTFRRALSGLSDASDRSGDRDGA